MIHDLLIYHNVIRLYQQVRYTRAVDAVHARTHAARVVYSRRRGVRVRRGRATEALLKRSSWDPSIMRAAWQPALVPVGILILCASTAADLRNSGRKYSCVPSWRLGQPDAAPDPFAPTTVQKTAPQQRISSASHVWNVTLHGTADMDNTLTPGEQLPRTLTNCSFSLHQPFLIALHVLARAHPHSVTVVCRCIVQKRHFPAGHRALHRQSRLHPGHQSARGQQRPTKLGHHGRHYR